MDSRVGGQTLLRSKEELEKVESEFIAQQQKGTLIIRTPPKSRREHHSLQSVENLERALNTKKPGEKRKAEGLPKQQEMHLEITFN